MDSSLASRTLGAIPSVHQNRSLNRLTLRVFGPVLVLTGLGGFLIPADLALMSGAPAYNVFHLVFGVLAMGLAAKGGLREAVAFNVGFGALDLYQAVASWGHWWPEAAFQWTVADDVAHVVIGLALVGVGLSRR